MLAFVLSMVVFAPSRVEAHTASGGSVYFKLHRSWNGYVVADGNIRKPTTPGTASWDYVYTATCSDTTNDHLYSQVRPLDAGGAPTSAWLNWGSALQGTGTCVNESATLHDSDTFLYTGSPHYAVRLVQYSERESAQPSPIATMATIRPTFAAVDRPENFHVVSATDREISLGWSDVEGETGFRLQWRRSGSSTWNLLAATGSNVLAWVHEGRSSGTTYEYRLRAEDATSQSDWTDVLLATTSGAGTEVTKGKLLSCNQAAALIYRGGWTTEALGIEGTAIMKGESGFYTAAVSYTGCCYGLMQINLEVHAGTKEQAFDPFWNVDKARDIYDAAGSSWQPWQAYTGPDAAGSDGPWTRHVDEVTPCVQKAMADGGASADTIDGAPEVGVDYDPVQDPDSATGLSCGLSMFCWIKAGLAWAFKPGEATRTAWESFKANLESKPPFSIAVAGFQWAVDVFDAVKFSFENPQCCGLTFDTGTLGGTDIRAEGDLGTPLSDFASTHVDLTRAVRMGAGILLVFATVMAVWRIMRSAFTSSKDEGAVEVEGSAGDEKEKES